jgi:uncharacterized RDD family membrane protein YckC
MPLSVSTGDAPGVLMAPGLTRRMAAWCYEGVLLFGVTFMAGLVFTALTRGRGALPAYRHAMQVFVFVVVGLYFVLCWSQGRGQTLAMKTWRIRLVDAQGRPVSRARALWRYVLCWLWFLPPLAAALPFKRSLAENAALCIVWVLAWALASRLQVQHQFWHDIWSGTRLIDAGPTRATAPPTF